MAMALVAFCLTASAQNSKTPTDGLIIQAENLIQNQEYDKAKLSLKLYQKQVEEHPQKWLKAQLLLTRIAIESNLLKEADRLINAGQAVVKEKKLAPMPVVFALDVLQAEILEIDNKFKEAEQIYRHILERSDYEEARLKLANNLIDRLLVASSEDPKADEEELRRIISQYEKNDATTPTALVPVKQKLDLYRMVNEETLKSLERFANDWQRKDEHTLFRIYLNNTLKKYNVSYEIWSQNRGLILLKTHPLTVPTLVNLSRHFLTSDLQKSREISQTLTVLARDETDHSLMTSLIVDQLIAENKTAEALSYYRVFTQKHKNIEAQVPILVSLAEAYLKEKDYQTSALLLAEMAAINITEPQLKARKIYVEASLLQVAGKGKDAAALFLRAGQMTMDTEKALESLFMAGRSFYDAKQCENAIIAFKTLLQKPWNRYSDDAMYYLSTAHAQCQDFKNAIVVIEQIVTTGKKPELKRKALLDKGNYYFQGGSIEKAIDAYNDYTLVYTKDSRNASIWFKVYEIHRSQKDLVNCDKVLSQIIANCRQSAPEVYSQALHQKALLYRLKGEIRESIKLWQTFLEFNQKVAALHKDEVKLMLAAAYQNADTLNPVAAKSIYIELINKTTDDQVRKIATYNLLRIATDVSEVLEENLGKILDPTAHFSTVSIDLLLGEILALPLKFITTNIESINSFISSIKNADQKKYWLGKLAAVSSDPVSPEKVADLFAGIQVQKYRYMQLLVMRDLYLSAGNRDAALTYCLDIIYTFTTKVSKNDYFNWQELEKSALAAAVILKESGNQSLVLKIRDRILATDIPEAVKMTAQIDKILEDKG